METLAQASTTFHEEISSEAVLYNQKISLWSDDDSERMWVVANGKAFELLFDDGDVVVEDVQALFFALGISLLPLATSAIWSIYSVDREWSMIHEAFAFHQNAFVGKRAVIETGRSARYLEGTRPPLYVAIASGNIDLLEFITKAEVLPGSPYFGEFSVCENVIAAGMCENVRTLLGLEAAWRKVGYIPQREREAAQQRERITRSLTWCISVVSRRVFIARGPLACHEHPFECRRVSYTDLSHSILQLGSEDVREALYRRVFS